jgi:hypothetical protein
MRLGSAAAVLGSGMPPQTVGEGYTLGLESVKAGLDRIAELSRGTRLLAHSRRTPEGVNPQY